MSGIAVSLGRTRMDLPPLVLRNDPFDDESPWWLPEDGVGAIGFEFRRTMAPESAYLPGDQPLAAVLDASTLPLTVYARAVPTATLEQVKAVLEVAVSQWTYNVTVAVGGESTTYEAFPAWPQWSAPDAGMSAARMARCSITIPINPRGA